MTSAERPEASGAVGRSLRHGLGLVLLLAAVLAWSERDSGFTVDEGSYAIQAEALDRGSWDLGWPFRAADPDGDHFPYHGGRVTDEAEHAYVSHPAWPAALSLVRGAGPEGVALRLLPAAAVVVAAFAAWALAGRLAGPAAAPWAFWVVATSPLLPNGQMLWAHAPATALAGVAVLAAVVLTGDRPAAWAWLALPAAVAGLVLVRSEGLLFAAALAAVVGLVGLAQRAARTVAVGVVAAGAAGAALLGERAWIDGIVGDGGRVLSSRAGSGGWLHGRLEGAGTALVDGASTAGPALCSVAAAALVAAAAVGHRQGRSRTVPLLAGAAVLTVVRLVVAPDDPVAGLLVAWPVVGLAALHPRLDGRSTTILAGAGLFALAVLATQYDDGGGLQWGGRYLAPLLVPVAAVVGAAVGARLARPERLAVGAVLAATALLAVVTTDEVRSLNAGAMDDVAALGEPVLLVRGDHLARLDWQGWPERCWLADDGDLAGAIDVLARAGVARAAYVGFPQEVLDGAGVEARPAGPGAVIGVLEVPEPAAGGEHAFAGCDRPLA